MTLQAGDLRHRIKLQRRAVVEDTEYGGPAAPAVWDDIVTVWAKRTNNLRTDGETTAGAAVIAPVRVRFDIYARVVDPAWRAIGVGGDHDGVIYEITNVGLSNDRSETALLCISGPTNG